MATAVGVRSGYSSAELRRIFRRCDDADQVRRLMALAVILDCGSRSEAAKVAGVTLQIVWDWVLRFNEAGPAGLARRTSPRPSASRPSSTTASECASSRRSNWSMRSNRRRPRARQARSRAGLPTPIW